MCYYKSGNYYTDKSVKYLNALKKSTCQWLFFFIISFMMGKKMSCIFFIYIGLPIYLSANVSPNLLAGLGGSLTSFTNIVGFPQTLKARSRYYLDLISFCLVLSLAFLTISQHPQGCSAVVIP